jgi:hypothetical protein
VVSVGPQAPRDSGLPGDDDVRTASLRADRFKRIQYPLPAGLTPRGQAAFERLVENIVRELTNEVDRTSFASSSTDSPEATLVDVERAYSAWINLKLAEAHRSSMPRPSTKSKPKRFSLGSFWPWARPILFRPSKQSERSGSTDLNPFVFGWGKAIDLFGSSLKSQRSRSVEDLKRKAEQLRGEQA